MILLPRVSPQDYLARWEAFARGAEYLELSPADRFLAWREHTADRDFAQWPVPIEEFVTNPFYVGEGVEVRPPVQRFMADFTDPRAIAEVLVMIGGIGCIAEGTRITLADGSTEAVEDLERQDEFDVATPDGPRRAAAFVRGYSKRVQVTTASGQTMTVGVGHRFLAPDGWRRADALALGERLLRFELAPPERCSALSPSASRGGAPRCLSRAPSSPDRCSRCCRRDDVQPRPASGSAPWRPPSPDDARGHTPPSWRSDDPGDGRASSRPCRVCARLATPCCERQAGLLQVDATFPSLPSALERTQPKRRVPFRSRPLTAPWRRVRAGEWDRAGAGEVLLAVAQHRARSDAGEREGSRHQARLPPPLAWRRPPRTFAAEASSPLPSAEVPSASLAAPSGLYDTVVGIEEAPSGVVYDLEVPGPDSYLAGGLAHHNSGKSFAAGLTLMYALYLLSCMRDPHAYLSTFPGVQISHGYEIAVINASAAGARQGVKVIYNDTLQRIEASSYFRQHWAPSPTKRSELDFPGRIRFAPGSSEAQSVLGFNVFAFAIDEAAFGRQSGDVDADQVRKQFEALNQRRRSRFGRLGLGGLFTSPQSESAYVEVLAEDAKQAGSDVMVRRISTWEAKGELVPGAEVFLLNRDPDQVRVADEGPLLYVAEGLLQRPSGEIVRYGPAAPTEPEARRLASAFAQRAAA